MKLNTLSSSVVAFVGAAILSAVVLPGTALASDAFPSERQPTLVETGRFDNPSFEPTVVYEGLVEARGDAPWVRILFKDVFLPGLSSVRLTSIHDGASQTLTQDDLDRRKNRSAYFNGATVRLEIIAGANSRGNRVRIEWLEVGGGVLSSEEKKMAIESATPKNICGVDDRILADGLQTIPDYLATTSAIGRLVVTYQLGDKGACTASILNRPEVGNDKCHLSAGHCFLGAVEATLEYGPEVKLSQADCNVNHPAPENQYEVDMNSLLFDGGFASDWAIFKTLPSDSMTDFERQGIALELSSLAEMPGRNAHLTITGFGADLEGVPSLSDSCSCDSRIVTANGERNFVRQSDSGASLRDAPSVYEYSIDTCGGSSGAPAIADVNVPSDFWQARAVAKTMISTGKPKSNLGGTEQADSRRLVASPTEAMIPPKHTVAVSSIGLADDEAYPDPMQTLEVAIRELKAAGLPAWELVQQFNEAANGEPGMSFSKDEETSPPGGAKSHGCDYQSCTHDAYDVSSSNNDTTPSNSRVWPGTLPGSATESHNHCEWDPAKNYCDGGTWDDMHFTAEANTSYRIFTCNVGSKSKAYFFYYDRPFGQTNWRFRGLRTGGASSEECGTDGRGAGLTYRRNTKKDVNIETVHSGNNGGPNTDYKITIETCDLGNFEEDDSAATGPEYDAQAAADFPIHDTGNLEYRTHCDDANDWLEIKNLKPNTDYQVYACNVGTDSDTFINLYEGPENNPTLLASDDDSGRTVCDDYHKINDPGKGPNPLDSMLIFNSGDRTSVWVEVTNFLEEEGVSRYEVHAEEFVPSTCPDSFEEDDTFAEAKCLDANPCSVATDDYPFEHSVANGNERTHCQDSNDFHKMFLEADKTYIFSTCNNPPRYVYPHTGDDTTLTVYDAQEVQLAFNDDWQQVNQDPPTGCETDFRASRLEFTPDVEGTYYVRIGTYLNGFNEGRKYSFTAAREVCSQDGFEPDNVFTQSNLISLDETQLSRNHCEDTADWLDLDLEAGRRYRIVSCDLGDRAATSWQLFGDLLSSPSTPAILTAANTGNVADCSGSGAGLTFTAPASGRHYLKVDSESKSGVFREYRVTFSSVCIEDSFEPDDDLDTVVAGTGLTIGTCIEKSLCDDSEDFAYFPAVAGETYIVSTCPVGSKSSTFLSLYEPGNLDENAPNELDFLQTGECGTGSSKLEVVAGSTGDYGLRVKQKFLPPSGNSLEYLLCVWQPSLKVVAVHTNGGCWNYDPNSPPTPLPVNAGLKTTFRALEAALDACDGTNLTESGLENPDQTLLERPQDTVRDLR